MSVTQLQPRKSAPSQRDPLVDLLAALKTEIRFAQAIELAILGEAALFKFDSSDLCTLVTVHRDRLWAIADKLESLKGGESMLDTATT